MSGSSNASRRPYRKASEYSSHQYSPSYTSTGTTKSAVDLQRENEELRERLHGATYRMEQMEVEFSQSKEYLESSLDITTEKLNRAIQQHKLLKSSYTELQAINYELEQKLLKINQLESEKSRLTRDVHDLTNKLTDARTFIHKLQNDNERLKNDCKTAVQLLECKDGSFRRQPQQQQLPSQLPRDIQDRVKSFQIDKSQYNEYINPYAEADSSSESEDEMERTQTYNPHNDQRHHQQGFAVPNQGVESLSQIPPLMFLFYIPSWVNDALRNQLGHILGNSKQPNQSQAYQQNGSQHAPYSGKFAEKKLIKPNYASSSPWEQKQNQGGNDKSSPWQQRTDTSDDNSPWQRQQQSSGSSPWQLASTNQQSTNAVTTDTYASSAFAYGATPTMTRRPQSANSYQPRPNQPTKTQSQPTSLTHHARPTHQINSNNNHSLIHNYDKKQQSQKKNILAAEEDLVMTLEVDDTNKAYYEMKRKNEQLIQEAQNPPQPQVDLLNLDDTAAVTSPLHGTDSISLEFDPLSSFQPTISGKILDSLSLLQNLESPQHTSSLPTEIVPPPPEDFANSPAKMLIPTEETKVKKEAMSILDLPLVEENVAIVNQPQHSQKDSSLLTLQSNTGETNTSDAIIGTSDVNHENLHSSQSDMEKVEIAEEDLVLVSDETEQSNVVVDVKGDEEVGEAKEQSEEQVQNHQFIKEENNPCLVEINSEVLSSLEADSSEVVEDQIENADLQPRRNSLEQAQGSGSLMESEERFI